MGKRAEKGKSVKKGGASKDFSARIKAVWAGFISFLKGLPKPKRIVLLAGAGAVLSGIIAGIFVLIVFLAGPPTTVKLIHPFENPLWMNAIANEARTFEEKNRRFRVEVVGMDYAGVNEASSKPETWDVAIGTSALLTAGASNTRQAVPFTGSIWGIYYNKEVMKKAGISPAAGQPGISGAFGSGDYSLEDLERAFARVKQTGKTPISLGSQFVWPLAIWIQAIMASGTSLQAASDLPKRDFDLSSSALEAATGKFTSYIDSGFVDPDHKEQDWPSSIRAVVNGDAAFCLVNEEFISALLPPERAKVGYLPLPGSVKGGKAKWAIGSLLYIGRSSKASSASGSKKLYDHLTGRKVAARLADALSAPFYSGGQGPDRVIPSAASVSTHPLMALLKEKFGIK